GCSDRRCSWYLRMGARFWVVDRTVPGDLPGFFTTDAALSRCAVEIRKLWAACGPASTRVVLAVGQRAIESLVRRCRGACLPTVGCLWFCCHRSRARHRRACSWMAGGRRWVRIDRNRVAKSARCAWRHGDHRHQDYVVTATPA